MTNEHKVLRGLSYISVIFAPILFPILVWIFTPQGSVTRDTAKHALWMSYFTFKQPLVSLARWNYMQNAKSQPFRET
ncbi:hypothetical protein H7K68_01615 [Lacticaseibacillus paracasei]|nr:hypothetical protein [Lacticaseibacillus paracasei]